MKKLLLVAFGALVALNLNAQTYVSDSTEMGASYRDDVYYSLSNGTVDTSRIKNWDLAFSMNNTIGNYYLGVLANHSNGVFVYKNPNIDASEWANFDTLGFKNWTQLWNTDTNWFYGAFNRGNYTHPQYSWAQYTGSGELTGDSLYLLRFEVAGAPGAPVSNTYKKLYLQQKKTVSGVTTFSFKYADLDGSNEQTVTLNGNDYPNRNYAYYSLRNNVAIDREPNNTTWDMVFTRYWAPQPPSGIFYQVSGVFTNHDIQVAEARGINISEADFNTASFSTNIGEIGYDWKSINMTTFMWDISDSLSYFVKDQSGDIWHMAFTAFRGSANGRSVFVKAKVGTVGIEEKNNAINAFAVFPNPASENVNLVFNNNLSSNVITVNVLDFSGKLVDTKTVNAANGLNNFTYNCSHLLKGMYIVNIQSNNGEIATQKLIKQ